MKKSALIFGGIAFLLSVGAVLLTPVLALCCIAPFMGLAAGYVAGVFDKPVSSGASSKTGAISGALAGIGAALGQIIGTVLNAFIVGPERAAEFMRNLGVPTSGGSGFASGYWLGMVGGTACFSLLDVLLMAGLGALGGLLWWAISRRKWVLGEPPPSVF